MSQEARLVAISGALVLGLGIATAVATAAPAERHVAQAAAISCEARSSGNNAAFYNGKSASFVYDRMFSRGPMLPGLATHTPQGIATWHNWNGSGNDLLVVTSYRNGANAWLIGIDPSSGRHVGTVAIAPTHAGGIAITKGWAFVQGKNSPTGHTIRKYRLSTLRTRMARAGTPYFKQTGTARKVYGASFIASYGDNLYAGRFNQRGRDRMYRYKVANNGALATQPGAYEVPMKAQGLLVTANRFIYSTSFGNDNRSNIYVMNGGARDIDNASTRCFRAPSMTEGITEHRGTAYLVYESGAAQYVAKDPRNLIRRMHKANLATLAAY
ncbi:MAG: hypothetical protein Q8O56_15515 [Solirubrobacteraceae bacterium]|nr:hypothetical protein [Solirubrobacteraceae bacterium]